MTGSQRLIERYAASMMPNYGQPRVEIRMDHGAPVLRIDVEGDDTTRVGGLLGELARVADRGRRWPA